jgi:hypothetical protein
MSRRGVRATVGLPGTGLSYVTKQIGGSRSRGSLSDELLTVIFIAILLGALKLVWSIIAGIGSALLGGTQTDPPVLPPSSE